MNEQHAWGDIMHMHCQFHSVKISILLLITGWIILHSFAAARAQNIVQISAQQAPSYASQSVEEKRRANANTVAIVGAQAASGLTTIIEDLQSVLDDPGQDGLRVLPILGKGGGQNILDVLYLRGIDMGLTDKDYLDYFERKNPRTFGDIRQKVQYIAKLFNSEFHLLASKTIKSYRDLSGKKVNCYKELSATSLAAENIFRTLNIEIVPTYYDQALAIQKLKHGEIAAVARLAGAPLPGYGSFTLAGDFHFVPLKQEDFPETDFNKLITAYLPTELRASDYPNLIPPDHSVPTVASSIVLAVYAWPEGSERYQKVARFTQKLFENFDRLLKKPRHPKWRQVNLAAKMPGWTRFKAAQDLLDQYQAGAAPRTGALKSAFERFLAKKTTAAGASSQTSADREAMFFKFMEWYRQRDR